MIIDPQIGTLDERRKAEARQYLAHQGFRLVASAQFGHHMPALLRASLKPKYIFDAMTDDELMLAAVTVGGQYRQRGRLVHFEHGSTAFGFCHESDTVALAEGHAPLPLAVGLSIVRRVRFTGLTETPTGWTDITNPALGGSYDIPNTNWSISITDAFAGTANDGAQTGNNSGVFPDGMLKGSFYIDGGNAGAALVIYGLSQYREHKIRVLSSTTAGASTAYWQCRDAITKKGFNGSAAWEASSLVSENNTANVVTFTVPKLIQPAPVELVVTIGAGTRAYLNALEIEQVP